jgi:hypothetical protein
LFSYRKKIVEASERRKEERKKKESKSKQSMEASEIVEWRPILL